MIVLDAGDDGDDDENNEDEDDNKNFGLFMREGQKEALREEREIEEKRE